jgi:hypothetical protein
MLVAGVVKNATLTVYKGGDHDLAWTHQNQVNAGLLAFLQS